MKCTMMLALFAAILVAVCALPADPTVRRRPPPKEGGFFRGSDPRRRRSPYDGRIKVDQHTGGKSSVQVDINQKIYEGKNGHVEVFGSAGQGPNQRPHADVGIRGEITFGGGRGGMTDDEVDKIRKELGLN